MILKRLQATFGRLDRETLDLQPGLNVLTAPNEAGKSTWAAFLLAMFYGIDTSERVKSGSLPAKVRYKPWSGKAMEGRVELEWNGTAVTLERTAQGRTPLGQFRAYETESGRELDLSDLTCGQTLLGVERSVWERSGFIRQQGLALTGDHALETRLNALVTTGEETVSYGQAAQRLRDLRNRRQSNKANGLLPQTRQELEQVREALDTIGRLGRETMELRARREELQRETARLGQLDAALKAREVARQRMQLDQARQEWDKQRRFLQEKEETVAGLPAQEDLEALLRDLDSAAETGAQLEADLRVGVARPEPPDCPPVFAGLDADGVRQKAEQDVEVLQYWSRPIRCSSLYPLNTVLLAVVTGSVLAVLFADLALTGTWEWGLCALAAACAVLTVLRAFMDRRALNRRAEVLASYRGISAAEVFRSVRKCQKTLLRYADDAAEIRGAANDYREALLLYGQQEAAALAAQAALDGRKATQEQRMDGLMAQVRAFAPDCRTPDEARAAVQKAVHLWKFYTAALRETQQAQVRYEAVQRAVGPLPEAAEAAPEVPEGDYDSARVARQLEQSRRELQEVQSRLDLQRGRMEAVGDPVTLAARQEQLTERLEQLQREYDALNLAMEALDQANAVLQTRFSPQLNELAGQYMARMTGGKYDRVLLDQAMSITARAAGDVVSHSLAALSAGTGDQLYLAVRLAISQLVLPPQAPLVLDDALVAFDDGRMASAMALLAELAGQRQILLFTCQGREQAWLDSKEREREHGSK